MIGLYLFSLVISGSLAAPGKCYNFFDCDADKQLDLTLSQEKAYPGDTITISCRGSGDPANLVITSGNAEVLPSVAMGDNRSVEANMTISNTIRNINVYCEDKTDSNLGCMDCKMINVYDVPEPVANVTCIVYNWTQSMTCSWKHGKSYRRLPTVTLNWRISSLSGRFCGWNNSCPVLDQHNSSCRWRSVSDGDFTEKTLDLNIKVISDGGRTAQRYFKINTVNFIQPNPVSNLQSRTINSTCVHLSWTPVRREFLKQYRIQYTAKSAQAKVFSTMLEDLRAKAATICNLTPYTTYLFTVQSKPSAENWDDISCLNNTCTNGNMENATCLTGNGYWSPARTTKAETHGAAPGKAPVVTTGSYEWDPEVCSQEQNNREVCMYWQSVDPAFIYGDLNEYLVNITDDADGTPQGIVTVSTNSTFHCTTLPCDKSYTISVSAVNQFGYSASSATIQIISTEPSYAYALLRSGTQSSGTISPMDNHVLGSFGPIPPDFIVEMSNTTSSEGKREVQVTWFNNTCDSQCDYTIYTCIKDGGRCAHNGHVHWRNVSNGQSSITFDMTSPDNYVYGVSVDSALDSSGFSWNSCIYVKDIAPPEPPGNTMVQPTDDGLLVSWDRQMCQPLEPYISIYLIEYCTGISTKDTKCYEREVASNLGSFELTSLEVGQTYSVRLRSVTETGLQGPWTEYIHRIITKPTAQKETHLEIVLPVAIISVLIILAVLILVWKLRKRYRAPKIQDVQMDIPQNDSIKKINQTKQFIYDEKVQEHDNSCISSGIYVDVSSSTPVIGQSGLDKLLPFDSAVVGGSRTGSIVTMPGRSISVSDYTTALPNGKSQEISQSLYQNLDTCTTNKLNKTYGNYVSHNFANTGNTDGNNACHTGANTGITDGNSVSRTCASTGNTDGNSVSRTCASTGNTDGNSVSHTGANTGNTDGNYVSHTGANTGNTDVNYVSHTGANTGNTDGNNACHTGASTGNTDGNYVSHTGANTGNTDGNYVSHTGANTGNTDGNYVSHVGANTGNTDGNYVSHAGANTGNTDGNYVSHTGASSGNTDGSCGSNTNEYTAVASASTTSADYVTWTDNLVSNPCASFEMTNDKLSLRKFSDTNGNISASFSVIPEDRTDTMETVFVTNNIDTDHNCKQEYTNQADGGSNKTNIAPKECVNTITNSTPSGPEEKENNAYVKQIILEEGKNESEKNQTRIVTNSIGYIRHKSVESRQSNVQLGGHAQTFCVTVPSSNGYVPHSFVESIIPQTPVRNGMMSQAFVNNGFVST